MSDLVERLRRNCHFDDCQEAADEIKKLRALVAALGGAPFPLHDYVTTEQWEATCHIYWEAKGEGGDGE